MFTQLFAAAAADGAKSYHLHLAIRPHAQCPLVRCNGYLECFSEHRAGIYGSVTRSRCQTGEEDSALTAEYLSEEVKGIDSLQKCALTAAC